ncbi:hypothetical protein ACVW17_003136 [Bradyrhizobium sp. USDA 4473]
MMRNVGDHLVEGALNLAELDTRFWCDRNRKLRGIERGSVVPRPGTDRELLVDYQRAIEI